jgi:anti-sigma factor RsiW
MNDPQKKPTPREELEMRLTALLLGELPPEEAAALEAQVAADPVLAVLLTRLRKAMELVREASKEPEAPVSQTPVQLSGERRARLLAHFQTPRPQPPQTVKLAKFPKPTQVKEKRARDWSWVIPLGVAATVVGLVVIELGTVRTKSTTDTPAVNLSGGSLRVDVANPTAMAPEDARGYAYQPVPAEPALQGQGGNLGTISGGLSTVTTNNLTTPAFAMAAPMSKMQAVPSTPSIATAAPANRLAMPGQAAAGGTASPVGHAMAMNNGWAESAPASPAAGGAAAPVPDRSTIY